MAVQISWKLVRRMIVQLALLTQCIMSIWLFARRVQHGSDALYDHRILQLAILGTSTAIMTMVHMLFEPHYPLSTWKDLPTKAKWLTFLRPLHIINWDVNPRDMRRDCLVRGKVFL